MKMKNVLVSSRKKKKKTGGGGGSWWYLYCSKNEGGRSHKKKTYPYRRKINNPQQNKNELSWDILLTNYKRLFKYCVEGGTKKKYRKSNQKIN